MSVYNSKLNALFIHIPRCAGHSMEEVLGRVGHEPFNTFFEFFNFYSIGLPDLKSVFKFAFVRHPFKRFISGYLYQGFNPKKINEYIKDGKCFDNIYFRPQWTFVCLPGVIPAMDFIGKYENLENDWNYVCGKMGIKHKLKHTNVSPKKKCRLNEESKKKLKFAYSNDFKLWYPEK